MYKIRCHIELHLTSISMDGEYKTYQKDIHPF